MSTKNIGERLLELKERSGISLAAIARGAGYKNPSSIQRYFSADYDVEHLPTAFARRLAEVMVGLGQPAIEHGDLEDLTEFGFVSVRSAHVDTRRASGPVIFCSPTTAVLAVAGSGLPDVEYMRVIEEDPVRAFAKAPHLHYRAIEAIYVATPTMAPRHGVGEIIFYELERPVAVGLDTLVFINKSGSETLVLLGKLAALSRGYAEFDLLEPPARVKIARGDIETMAAIMTAQELLEPAPIR